MTVKEITRKAIDWRENNLAPTDIWTEERIADFVESLGVQFFPPSGGAAQPKWVRQESCSECDGDGCAKCGGESGAPAPPADVDSFNRVRDLVKANMTRSMELESRLSQAKRLQELTLQNQIVWMQKYEAIRTALESANSLCRSAFSIAQRKGSQTNWDSFIGQLKESLKIQHKVMYPEGRVIFPQPSPSPEQIKQAEGTSGGAAQPKVMINREAFASVLLDGGTRRSCNNPDCGKDYGHSDPCSPGESAPASPAQPTNAQRRKVLDGLAKAEMADGLYYREPEDVTGGTPAEARTPNDRRDCPKCRCLIKAHHGPFVGCEGAGGNCGCALTVEEIEELLVGSTPPAASPHICDSHCFHYCTPAASGGAAQPPDGEDDFVHDEDCPCFGDVVDHSADCKNCTCEKPSPGESAPAPQAQTTALEALREVQLQIERMDADAERIDGDGFTVGYKFKTGAWHTILGMFRGGIASAALAEAGTPAPAPPGLNEFVTARVSSAPEAWNSWKEARAIWRRIVGNPPRVLDNAEHDLDDLLNEMADVTPPAASDLILRCSKCDGTMLYKRQANGEIKVFRCCGSPAASAPEAGKEGG